MSLDDAVILSPTSVQDLLLNSEDITEFLEGFTALLAERLSDGSGATVWCAVSLLREKKAATAASSSPQALALDELQNSFPDGPCMTAIREHTVVRVGDVLHDKRWPTYHSAAIAHGVRSVLGLPFELDQDSRAGLNVYSEQRHDFTPEMISFVEHEVRQTSNALRLAIRLARHRDTENQLREALASRTTIDLAVGMLMAQKRCGQDEAVTILKTASNTRNIKLRDLASSIVASLDQQPPGTHFSG
ncbi:GAF and ANTAR domain-containing protein [Brachybacterium tyrofermentans]